MNTEDKTLQTEYILTPNMVEFFQKNPTYYRYYVEGFYDYPEGFAEDPDEDTSFCGYYTLYGHGFITPDAFVSNGDRIENQYFKELYSATEIIEMLKQDSYNAKYMVVTKVHQLTYTVSIETLME